MAKRYAVDMEDGRVVSVEVDGVTYTDPDDVPDPDDREKVRELMAAAPQADEPAPAPFPIEKVVLGVFAGVSALLLLISVLTGISTSRALAREVRVEGRVAEMVVRTVEVPRDRNGPDRNNPGTIDRDFYYPVVEFKLPDGTQKTVQTAEGSWPPSYEVGQAVTVLYDGENPLDARIASPSSTVLQWTWTLITGALGLAFAVPAGLLLRAIIRYPRKPTAG